MASNVLCDSVGNNDRNNCSVQHCGEVTDGHCSPSCCTMEMNLSGERTNLHNKRMRSSWHVTTNKQRICSKKDDIGLDDLYAANLSKQIRAVSSPSLSENPLEPNENATTQPTESAAIYDEGLYEQSHTSGSVLQKFKKTFSQFKSKHSPVTSVGSVDITQSDTTNNKYRFGPLMWRSSKERRKTKHLRRDKCNSGDSGIQVEFENDNKTFQDATTPQPPPVVEASSPLARVRRTNSAKTPKNSVTIVTTTHKSKHHDDGGVELREKNIVPPLPNRSRSQPSGLDLISMHHTNNDSDSDSISSNHNYCDDENHTFYAEILYPFVPVGPQELGLEKGALVEVLRHDHGPWWWGRLKHDAILSDRHHQPQEGWFPKEFVRVLPQFPKPNAELLVEAKNCDIKMAIAATSSSSPKGNIGNATTPTTSKTYEQTASQQNRGSQSSEAIRNSVIKELLETEINYVKLLSSLCVGFIKELRQRPDIFPTESLILIFSNIEKIWRFQQTFLDALRNAIEHSCIAETFLEYQSAFMVYSTYCNSYSKALMELESYSHNNEASAILESCRVAQNLPELPLSAHLLAPIQRICRYPLHLSELVKHSDTRREVTTKLKVQIPRSETATIDCKESFEMALTAMKRVTEMVNEGKRHSEYLSRIQARFDNFQGPPINVHSSRLFLQTDAIRMSPNLWNNSYTIFLFDRQLIYCKKDLLKRTHFIYKGRIFLDSCRVLNLPDGKMFGATLKNALRLYCDTRNKWFDFCFRSSSSKLRFLNTLSAERQFCGRNLFVSELSGADFDNMSDKEYGGSIDHNDIIEHPPIMATLPEQQQYRRESSLPDNALEDGGEGGSQKSDTLPKNKGGNSRKNSKSSYTDYQTNSLGRRKIGNWFRKSRSTNSTPSQSPTHRPSESVNVADALVNAISMTRERASVQNIQQIDRMSAAASTS